jgi:hypothetical protein
MRRPKKYKFEATTEELKQAAVIVDADCWITVYGRDEGGYSLSFKFRREEDPDDAQFLHGIFGGYLGNQIIEGKYVYWLSIQAGRAWAFLKVIDPYIKRRRLSFEVLKKLRESIDKNNGRVMSDEMKEYRHQLIDELKGYNNRFFEWKNAQNKSN